MAYGSLAAGSLYGLWLMAYGALALLALWLMGSSKLPTLAL
jgi:hypothetical protein